MSFPMKLTYDGKSVYLNPDNVICWGSQGSGTWVHLRGESIVVDEDVDYVTAEYKHCSR